MTKDRPHYYMKNPARDERTRLARGVDYLLALLLVWFLSALAAQALPLGRTGTAVVAVILLALGTALVIRYHALRCHSRKLHRDIWHAALKCRDNLKAMASPRDFAVLVKELMESTLPVEHLKILAPAGDSAIHLTGYLRGRKMGVMCINPGSAEHQTSVRELKTFAREITGAGLAGGIVITSGSFSDEARRYARRMGGKTRLHLVDGYGLLRLARRAKHPVFPDEKWQDEKDIRMSGLQMALSIKENILASRRKSVTFIALGLVLVVISALQEGIIGPAYLLFGIINLFIGFSGLVLSYLRKHELLVEWP